MEIFDEAMCTAKDKSKGPESMLIGDSKYSGEILNGEAHGYGICNESEEQLYEGQWKQNEKHGVGTMRFRMGDISYFFAGEWHEDQMHGMGLWTWSDGARFCGNFHRGTTKQGPGMQM